MIHINEANNLSDMGRLAAQANMRATLANNNTLDWRPALKTRLASPIVYQELRLVCPRLSTSIQVKLIKTCTSIGDGLS